MAKVFDIETDGLNATLIHCIVIYDTETKEYRNYTPANIKKGVMELVNSNGELLVGHNIIDYDIPTIERIFQVTIPKNNLFDTLVVARIVFSNIAQTDYTSSSIPVSLKGSHSLKAYGYRLGELKGEYGAQTNAWEFFNDNMLTYCKQDVNVTNKLYEVLKKNTSDLTDAIQLEQEAQILMTRMEQTGYPFNVTKAKKLQKTLKARSTLLEKQITELVPQIPDKPFIPKRSNKTKGYIAGVPVKRYKKFNPNSRDQLRYIITKHYNYTPTDVKLFDEKGMLKVDEPTFNHLTTSSDVPPKLKQLATYYNEYLMIGKRLGQLSDGKYAWLKLYDKQTGCIHGRINPNGTVTGRATHSTPNVAQVPAVKVPYGKECRELFCVPKGWKQIGIDTSGLELRCLSHFLYPFDNGAYAHEVVNGDVHTKNQHSAGLTTRDEAKTFIYAFLYGAGDAKIGSIVGGGQTEGKRLRNKFLANTPALSQLRERVENTLIMPRADWREPIKWKRRFLYGLDKRRLYVRSVHSALNLLLQSAGALICKRWIVELDKELQARGYVYGWSGDYTFLTWVHDEVQIASHTIPAEEINEISTTVLKHVQKHYGFRVQLDTEMKVGENWAECH